MLIAAVSMLAVLAASGALLQRNMAANFKGGSLALENAAIAASFAHAWLNSQPDSAREADCIEQCVLPVGVHGNGELPVNPEFEGAGWWRENGHPAGYNPATASTPGDADLATRSAYWLIEEVWFHEALEQQSMADTGYYRILSRGEGKKPNHVAVVEIIAARPWQTNSLPTAFPPIGPGHDYCRQFSQQQPCGVLSWRRRR
jgi:hypothetical protein